MGVNSVFNCTSCHIEQNLPTAETRNFIVSSNSFVNISGGEFQVNASVNAMISLSGNSYLSVNGTFFGATGDIQVAAAVSVSGGITNGVFAPIFVDSKYQNTVVNLGAGNITSFGDSAGRPTGFQNLVISGGKAENWYKVTAANPRSNRTLAINDPGGNASFGLSLGDITLEAPTSTIPAGTCTPRIAGKIVGLSSTNTLVVNPLTDPSDAGYKALTVWAFPSTDTANLIVCNPSAGPVSPRQIRFKIKAF
jgi:hypothetical protein